MAELKVTRDQLEGTREHASTLSKVNEQTQRDFESELKKSCAAVLKEKEVLEAKVLEWEHKYAALEVKLSQSKDRL